jgi:hypothetical protein
LYHFLKLDYDYAILSEGRIFICYRESHAIIKAF